MAEELKREEQKQVKEAEKEVKVKPEEAKPKPETKEVKPKPEAKAERSPSEIILHKKPAKLLALLLQDKAWHTSALARESGQSYVYATNTLKVFEKGGIVVSSLKGKKRIIKLTEKGEKIAKAIQEIGPL